MGQSCVFLKIQITKDNHIYINIIYPFWFPRKWFWKKPTGCFWAHFGTHPFTNPKPNPWVFGRSQPQRVPSNPGEICSALSLATLVVGGHPDGNRGAKKWSIKLSELIRIYIYIYIYTYMHICQHTWEGGGRKPASKQMLRRRFFLCVLCSVCCIWELCTTEINFSLLAVSPQQPILLLRLGGLSQKYRMANLRNLVVSRWLEIVFIRPMHSKRMKDQTTQPRVCPGDFAVRQAFAKTFYNTTIECLRYVYPQRCCDITPEWWRYLRYTQTSLDRNAFTHRPVCT